MMNDLYFNEKLAAETRDIIDSILTYGGDAVGYVNAATAIGIYMEDNLHPLIDTIVGPLSLLPPGESTDEVFDLLLRLAVAALLGQSRIDATSDAIRNGRIKLELEDPNDKLDEMLEIDIDYLFQQWKRNPDNVVMQGRYSNLLFAQYVARLFRYCNIMIESRDRQKIIEPFLNLSSFEDLGQQPQRLVSWLMLGASTAQMFGLKDSARSLLLEAHSHLEYFQIVKQVEFDLTNTSHIGISTRNLYDSYQDLCHPFGDLLKNVLIESLRAYNDPAAGSIRLRSLRLAGLRSILSEDNVLSIQSELEASVGIETIVGIKKYLSTYLEYAVELRSLLNERGIDINNPTPRQLFKLAQDIEYESLHNITRSPVDTLKAGVGDCKAVTTLIATILMYAGKSANICLFYGKDLDMSTNNHIFIEWVGDRAKYDMFGKAVFIDQLSEFGQPNRIAVPVGYDHAILRFPLEQVSVYTVPQLIRALSRERTAIRRLIASEGT